MSYTAIQFETDGPVATITMDRPEKRNALNHALLDDSPPRAQRRRR